jgi:L-ascorbate metabolism protein UlaG (beta-lactamase superfamily)
VGGSCENALCRFAVEGINIAHIGDRGNALSVAKHDSLKETDMLLAPAGGHPTIDLEALEQVIHSIQPQIVIPMRFRVPGPRFFMLPATDFTQQFPASQVHFAEGSSLEPTAEILLDSLLIMVLQASKHKPAEAGV